MNSAALTAIRELATIKKSVYPFTLHFTREFTKGDLVGMTHEDTIGFCRESDACEWVSVVNQKAVQGKCEYKVISWKIVRS